MMPEDGRLCSRSVFPADVSMYINYKKEEEEHKPKAACITSRYITQSAADLIISVLMACGPSETRFKLNEELYLAYLEPGGGGASVWVEEEEEDDGGAGAGRVVVSMGWEGVAPAPEEGWDGSVPGAEAASLG